jgi:hypothetical protein
MDAIADFIGSPPIGPKFRDATKAGSRQSGNDFFAGRFMEYFL